MKRQVLVAASSAILGLTACTHDAGHSAAATHGATPSSQGTHAAIVPVTCREQYRRWTDGGGKGLMRTLTALTSAAAAADAHAARNALERARPQLARAAAHPIPACADPQGYWTVLLMHVSAAASGPRTAAQAALRAVPKIHQQLQVEVRQLV